MKGRQRFKCEVCGLELEGRLTTDGRIKPWDRGPYDGSPVRPFRCVPNPLCPGNKTSDAQHGATSAEGGARR